MTILVLEISGEECSCDVEMTEFLRNLEENSNLAYSLQLENPLGQISTELDERRYFLVVLAFW